MLLTREKKNDIINDLGERFSKSKSIVFLGFQSMAVKEVMELRKKLRGEKVEYKVARKTLIKRGLDKAKLEGAKDLQLEGPVAVAMSYDDEVAPARLSNEYFRMNAKLKILGGYVSAKYLNAAEIKVLALLPGKDQLRAQLIGTINAPASGFVNVLAGNIRGLVTVIKAIGDKKK